MSEHKMPKIWLGAVTDGDGNDLEGHAYITSCDEDAELEIKVEGADAHVVAPLIVRAANSHDALVADAEFLLDRLEEFERSGLDECNAAFREYTGHVHPAASRLRATLRLAKGDQSNG